MSTEIQGRIIHPSVLEALSFEEIKAMITMRDNLADPNWNESFLMTRINRNCGSPSCMAGHMGALLGMDPDERIDWFKEKVDEHKQLLRLFHFANPNDRHHAVKAVDHYLETGDGIWPYWNGRRRLFRQMAN